MTQPVLRARTSTALAPVAQQSELDVELRRAQAISQAGQALPPSYRNNPGAVLLADQWARQRGIDTLTAIQNVAFVNGRPVVDATFQRAMAEANGYTVAVIDASNEAATVAISNSAGELGRVTWTMDDARRAKLDSKDTWKQYPRNMLTARATTDAIRWHAPQVLLGVMTADEIESDPVAVIRAVPDQPAEPEAAPAPAEAEVIEDAVLVEDEPSGWTSDTLKQALRNAGITQSQALQATSCPTIADLASKPILVDKVLFSETEQPSQGVIDDSPF